MSRFWGVVMWSEEEFEGGVRFSDGYLMGEVFSLVICVFLCCFLCLLGFCWLVWGWSTGCDGSR